MKESTFCNQLRDKLTPKGAWTRVESVAGNGVPDINWFPGQDVWIEAKVSKGLRVVFQSSQLTWAKKRHDRKSFVWVIIRHNKEIILATSLDIYDKMQYSNKPWLHVNCIKENGVTFKKPFNWNALIDILRGKLKLIHGEVV